MGMGNVVKAIWTLLNGTTSPNVSLIWNLLNGTTNPDVVALYNNLYQNLEGAKMGLGKGRKGNVFFVNGGADGVTTGLDTNSGKTPALAFLTIAHAIALCTVNDNDDFIYCFNVYNQDAFPITITGDSIHIIGLAGPDGSWPQMDANADAEAVFYLPSGIENCEIAGFSLGAGAAHGCIELAIGNNMTWIHNCTFGHEWVGGGQDGVRLVTGTTDNVLVEDCWFYGNCAPGGKLTRSGVISLGTTATRHCTIRNNYFVRLPGPAIHILGNTAWENSIIHNIIGRGADAQGNAITLNANCEGCLVSGNEAAFGPTAEAGLTAPYLDQAGGTANDWCSNQSQEIMKIPA